MAFFMVEVMERCKCAKCATSFRADAPNNCRMLRVSGLELWWGSALGSQGAPRGSRATVRDLGGGRDPLPSCPLGRGILDKLIRRHNAGGLELVDHGVLLGEALVLDVPGDDVLAEEVEGRNLVPRRRDRLLYEQRFVAVFEQPNVVVA